MNPEAIIIEEDIRGEEFTRRLLAELEGVEVKSDPRFWLSDVRFIEGDCQANMKKVIRLSRRTKDLARRCPGQRGMLCCSYFVLDLALGCPADCHYCILQDVLQDLPITINANVDEILDDLQDFLTARGGSFTRIGTGELSDSLALEGLTHFAERLVPFFSRQQNAVFELKTKWSDVALLEGIDARGRTIVSMSLAPQQIIDSYERGTSPLAERLRAASQCSSWGYPVGFHLDPVILEGDWKSAYAAVIEDLRGSVDSSDIAWISLGAFRFTGKLERVIRERFPGSGLLSGEFVRCSDGKFRYPEVLRSRAYRFLYEMIRSWSGDFPVYLCMESPHIWEEVTGDEPPSPATLSSMLDARARHFLK
jgi:spore photoproduct lyase